MIIGFVGQRRSGKDTAALAFGGYEQASFAHALKEICRTALGVEVTEQNKEQKGNWLEPKGNYDIRFLGAFYNLIVEYDTIANTTAKFDFESTVHSQELLQALFHESDKGELTPRRVLQVVGTDVFRAWNENAWVDALKAQIGEGDYVITDCRFQNEVDFIHSLGGMVIRIDRPETDSATIEHASEDVKNLTVDAVVVNDSSIDTLHDRVRLAYLEWTIARPDYWEGVFTQYGS